MRKAAAALACLFCMGHGRRVQTSSERLQSKPSTEVSSINRLAKLLLEPEPSSAFRPSSPSTRSLVRSPFRATSRPVALAPTMASSKVGRSGRRLIDDEEDGLDGSATMISKAGSSNAGRYGRRFIDDEEDELDGRDTTISRVSSSNAGRFGRRFIDDEEDELDGRDTTISRVSSSNAGGFGRRRIDEDEDEFNGEQGEADYDEDEFGDDGYRHDNYDDAVRFVGENDQLDGDMATTPKKTILTGEFRKANQITVIGEDDKVYAPMLDYEQTPFDPSIKSIFRNLGYTKPTATQAQSWPIALDGRDIISIARTGSGKTCGFLMPAFHKLMTEPQEEDDIKHYGRLQRRGGRSGSHYPRVLVLAPTRELVQQIEQEAQKYAKATNTYSISLFGGAPKGGQIRELQNGVDVIVATPGRCNDLLDMGVIDIRRIKYLVLDEADRMLDMGFEPQIRAIIEELPMGSDGRQSLMFSATWPREIRQLAKEFLTNPVQVTIGDGDSLTANKAIKQHVKVVRQFEKDSELFRLLDQVNPSEDHNPNDLPKTLIFVSRKQTAEDLADIMYDQGYRVDKLHGDMSQFQRTKAMDRFKAGRSKLLVATDVAARGLDVTDIEVVVNYDMPSGISNGAEDYVHRIGRTGRAERGGSSYAFFTPSDFKLARAVIGVLERAKQDIPQELWALAQRGSNTGKTRNQARSQGGGRSQSGNGYPARHGTRDRFGGGSSSAGGGYDRQGGNRRSGGDRYSGGGENRYGGDRNGGRDRFGGGDRYGGRDRYGGGDRYGVEERYGGSRYGDGDRYGAYRDRSAGSGDSYYRDSSAAPAPSYRDRSSGGPASYGQGSSYGDRSGGSRPRDTRSYGSRSGDGRSDGYRAAGQGGDRGRPSRRAGKDRSPGYDDWDW